MDISEVILFLRLIRVMSLGPESRLIWGVFEAFRHLANTPEGQHFKITKVLDLLCQPGESLDALALRLAELEPDMSRRYGTMSAIAGALAASGEPTLAVEFWRHCLTDEISPINSQAKYTPSFAAKYHENSLHLNAILSFMLFCLPVVSAFRDFFPMNEGSVANDFLLFNSKDVSSSFHLKAPEAKLSILDLCCGTGLAGPILCSISKDVGGIDASSEMIEIAKARGVYRSLVRGDLFQILDSSEDSYDFVFMAGAAYYFSDLNRLFRTISRVMKPGAIFAFQTFPSPDGHDIMMTIAGTQRYCHSESFIRKCAAETGMKVEQTAIGLSYELPSGFYLLRR